METPKNRFKHVLLDENDKNLEIMKSNLETVCLNNEILEFDKKIISMKVSNINFDDIKMGDFTFFNIFFNSQGIVV